MTGPEFMVIVAAMQVGGAALLRAAVPLCRQAPAVIFWGCTALVEGFGVPLFAVLGWWAAGGQAIAALIALALWWSRRKGRKRAARWLGAKSRAARDALVRRAREALQPRPVLAPGGAHAR